MRILLGAVLAILLTVATSGARAEGWVQIEARPTLEEAAERAAGYAVNLPNVHGFTLRNGRWHGVALGPYAGRAEAREALRALRRAGLIPSDSYVVGPGYYRSRYWPPFSGEDRGAPGAAAPRQEAGQETLAQARRGEAALDRESRRELQRALAWFGHYDAAIDGDFGRATRAAMAAWQQSEGHPATGVLTSGERADLLQARDETRAALGFGQLEDARAGLTLTAPLGMVRFDQVRAPFVHYGPQGGSGLRLSLISQLGDEARLLALYHLVQTLDIVPTEGDRSFSGDSFRIRGEAGGRGAEVVARLEDGRILGFLLSWEPGRKAEAVRALTEMEATLRAAGPPLPSQAGFDPSGQSVDQVAGLEVRRPAKTSAGFFVDGMGSVMTAADTVTGCARITLDRSHPAERVAQDGTAALLRPLVPLVPQEVALLAPEEGRLHSDVAVGGYPFGGVLGAATLTRGTLGDVRGLGGEEDRLRLQLAASEGDAGGPVLDEAGRVAGMLLPRTLSTDRTLPPGTSFALKSRALTGLLQRTGVAPLEVAAPAAPLSIAELSTRAMGMTVLVECWTDE
jgi:hypothetical protein